MHIFTVEVAQRSAGPAMCVVNKSNAVVHSFVICFSSNDEWEMKIHVHKNFAGNKITTMQIDGWSWR